MGGGGGEGRQGNRMGLKRSNKRERANHSSGAV